MADPWANDPIVGGASATAAQPWAADPLVGSVRPLPSPEQMQPYLASAATAEKLHGLPAGSVAGILHGEMTAPGQVSPSGAITPLQILPGTAREMNMDPRFLATNPAAATFAGAAYLGKQYKKFGNLRDAYAAYNAGPGREANDPAGPSGANAWIAAGRPTDGPWAPVTQYADRAYNGAVSAAHPGGDMSNIGPMTVTAAEQGAGSFLGIPKGLSTEDQTKANAITSRLGPGAQQRRLATANMPFANYEPTGQQATDYLTQQVGNTPYDAQSGGGRIYQSGVRGAAGNAVFGLPGVLYGGLSGLGSQGAKEAGAPPWLQTVAGIAAPVLGGMVMPRFGGAPTVRPQSLDAAAATKTDPYLGTIPPPPPPGPGGGSLFPRGAGGSAAIPASTIDSRVANFKALNIKPTASMIYRDPSLQQDEWDLSADLQHGIPLKQAYQNVNQGLADRIQEIKDNARAGANSDREAGQTVIDDLTTKWDEMQSDVGKLYTGVRQTVGENFGAPLKSLLSELDQASDIAEADPIVSSVQRRLARLGIADPNGTWTVAKNAQPRTALNVNQSEELRKFIGKLTASSPTQKMVQNKLIDALDDDVINGAGVDHFQTARTAARVRFSEFSRKTLGSIQQDKMEPEDVLPKIFWQGKVADAEDAKSALLTGTPDQIARGQKAFNNVRGQTTARLSDAAFGPDGGGKFNPRSFNTAWDKIGDERMNLIFDQPGEMAQWNRIRMAGHDAFSTVPFNTYNASHSGTYLANAMRSGFADKSSRALGFANKGADLFASTTGVPVGIVTRPLQKGLEKMGKGGFAEKMANPDVAKISEKAARMEAQARARLLFRKRDPSGKP